MKRAFSPDQDIFLHDGQSTEPDGVIGFNLVLFTLTSERALVTAPLEHPLGLTPASQLAALLPDTRSRCVERFRQQLRRLFPEASIDRLVALSVSAPIIADSAIPDRPADPSATPSSRVFPDLS